MIVSAENSGLRLDLFLLRHARNPRDDGGVSRSGIQRLIVSGDVKVNGKKAKPGARVRANDLVDIHWPVPRESSLKAEQLPLSILYEDDDCIVINKAPGIVVHPAAGSYSGTLVHALLYHCPDLPGIGGERRPGIVHRLDKDTSGVMVVVKNEIAFRRLAQQFKERFVFKEYLAVVWGRPRGTSGAIVRPIGRHRINRKKMSSRYPVAHSREAVTEWQLEQFFEVVSDRKAQPFRASLIRLRPRTGRTHQIRVHLADEDCPIMGDRVYGGRKRALEVPVEEAAHFPRQALHAERLGFLHPRTGARVEFHAPLPQDMANLLDALTEAASERSHQKMVDNQRAFS